MKKILLLTAVSICMVLSANGQTSVWDGSHSTWTNGAGTQESPYLIENAAQLAHLAYIVNNGIDANNHTVGANIYWKLMTDIDLNGSESFQWTPIGYYNSYADSYSFGGNFDGNNHTIANLYINTTTLRGIGLFGYTFGAKITNLGITGSSSVTRGSASSVAIAGAIAGYAHNTDFDNCYNTGSVSSACDFSHYSDNSSYSGGVVGYAESNVTVNNCYNTGSISSYSSSTDCYSGGVVGFVYAENNVTVNNCYNTGSVSASAAVSSYYESIFSYSGGVVGFVYVYAENNVTVTDCYNTGNISSTSYYYSYSGGVVGYAVSTTITDCYNTGNVSSTSDYYSCYSGGIAGDAHYTIVNNCYNIGNVSAYSTYSSTSFAYNSASGGIIGYLDNDTTINNCYNTGNIFSSVSDSSYFSSSGGIAGYADNYTTVNNCYNRGRVSSSATSPSYSYSGGIVGEAAYYNTTVNNCYNIGMIISIGNYKGGIVGFRNGSGAVNNSYYLDTCGGDNTYGGEAKTEELMKDAGVVTLLNQDLATPAWEMDCNPPINNGFPILLWQTCEGSDAVETIENQSIIIYPNPAKDIITVASSELQNETYTVFSISGQALMHDKLQGETTTVNVSSLASGVYYLKVANKTAKFIKN